MNKNKPHLVSSAHILLINKSGKILLTRRQDIRIWVVPGGGANTGESSENAAVRELKEEVGLTASKPILKIKYLQSNNKEKHFYVCSTFSGRIDPDPVEVFEAKWFNPKKLPEPMSMYEKKRIKTALKLKNRKNDICQEKYSINIRQELLNQMKNPFIFTFLMWRYFLVRLRKGSFKF